MSKEVNIVNIEVLRVNYDKLNQETQDLFIRMKPINYSDPGSVYLGLMLYEELEGVLFYLDHRISELYMAVKEIIDAGSLEIDKTYNIVFSKLSVKGKTVGYCTSVAKLAVFDDSTEILPFEILFEKIKILQGEIKELQRILKNRLFTINTAFKQNLS